MITDKHLRGPATVAIGVSIAMTFAAGTAAVATAKTRSAVKACVTSKGFLESASKSSCPHGTTRISLDVTGPRGPKGSNGASGYSTAIVGKDLTFNLPNLDGTYQTTLTIPTAPAGTYVVTFSYGAQDFDPDDSGNADVECQILAGGAKVLNQSEEILPGQLGVDSGTAVATLSAAGAINVQCLQAGGTAVGGSYGSLVATRVNSVVTSS